MEEQLLFVHLGEGGFVVEPLRRPVRRVDFCGVQKSDDEDGEFFMVCEAKDVEDAKKRVLESRIEWVKKEREGMLEEAERYGDMVKELEGMRSKMAVKDIELVDWCEVSFWVGNKDFKVSQRKVPANDKINFPECEVLGGCEGHWLGKCLLSRLGECKKEILDRCRAWLEGKEKELEREIEEVRVLADGVGG